jgi:hypothetical protein
VCRLAASALLSRLRVLRLWNNWNLTDAAVTALASSRKAAGLEELDLRGFRDLESNAMSNEAARALARSPHLRNLRRLRVGHWANLTTEGVTELRNAFGDRVGVEERPNW